MVTLLITPLITTPEPQAGLQVEGVMVKRLAFLALQVERRLATPHQRTREPRRVGNPKP